MISPIFFSEVLNSKQNSSPAFLDCYANAIVAILLFLQFTYYGVGNVLFRKHANSKVHRH